MSSVSYLLAKAKEALAVPGSDSPRNAAKYISAAHEQGASQRDIAKRLGKSGAWVNRLLTWQRGGFAGDPFGAGHHTERAFTPTGEQNLSRDDRARIAAAQAAAKKKDRDYLLQEFIKAATGWREAINAQREAERRLREYETRGFRLHPATQLIAIDRESRDRLTKLLGMLGSSGDGEVVNAARMAEDLRRRLKLTWPDLIIACAGDAT